MCTRSPCSVTMASVKRFIIGIAFPPARFCRLMRPEGKAERVQESRSGMLKWKVLRERTDV